MTDAEFHCELRRELNHASWRAVRPLFLAMLLVLVSIWAVAARSATVTLSCTAPTQYTDGSPIGVPLTYKAYWGTSATTLTSTAIMAGPGCKGSVVAPDPAPGTSITYHFAVSATANGIESAKSNVITKTLSTPFPTPNPPTGLMTVETVGYQLNLGSNNRIYFSRAGTVPLGLGCQEGMEVMSKSVIKNRDALVLDPGKTRPRQVFVMCVQS